MTASRAAALVCLLASAACAPSTVTRVIDGEQLEGRAIAAEAYAAYAKAELFAAQGDRKQALHHLEQALELDPKSPELSTRYGEMLCEERVDADALDRFERALALDPAYAPAFLGRARCLWRAGQRDPALAAAETAAALDPMSLDTTRELTRFLFALGRAKEAWRWLEARALLEPAARGPQALLLEAAEREHDGERAARARAFLDIAPTPDGPPAKPAVPRTVAASPAVLDGAERRMAADPEDTEAWTAGLVAADLLGDDRRFATILAELGENPLPASPAALARLAELVERRCGTEAAAALTRATSP